MFLENLYGGYIGVYYKIILDFVFKIFCNKILEKIRMKRRQGVRVGFFKFCGKCFLVNFLFSFSFCGFIMVVISLKDWRFFTIRDLCVGFIRAKQRVVRQAWRCCFGLRLLNSRFVKVLFVTFFVFSKMLSRRQMVIVVFLLFFVIMIIRMFVRQQRVMQVVISGFGGFSMFTQFTKVRFVCRRGQVQVGSGLFLIGYLFSRCRQIFGFQFWRFVLVFISYFINLLQSFSCMFFFFGGVFRVVSVRQRSVFEFEFQSRILVRICFLEVAFRGIVWFFTRIDLQRSIIFLGVFCSVGERGGKFISQYFFLFFCLMEKIEIQGKVI